MKRVDFFLYSPGGNITAIVPLPFNEYNRHLIASRIMKSYPNIEQVGFVNNYQEQAWIEFMMMGDELSGNGLASLGMYLFDSMSKESESLLVETCGINVNLSTAKKYDSTRRLIRVSFPHLDLELIKLSDLDVVVFPGIAHAVVLDADDQTDPIVRKIINMMSDLNSRASGVMFVDQIGAELWKLNPYVFVSSTNTLVQETACSTGSIAAAYFLRHSFSMSVVDIIQPSQENITIEFQTNNVTEFLVSVGFLGKYSFRANIPSS